MWITPSWFGSNAKQFFCRSLYNFSVQIFSNLSRLRSEIPSRDLSDDGVIKHAESEYDIFIVRQPSLENSSMSMWKRLSYFLLRNLFIKIFAPHLDLRSEIIKDPCSALYALSNEMISMETARRKFFEKVDMLPLGREFNSAYYSSGFRINTGIWANASSEYQLGHPKSSVFPTKPLVFVRWPTLEKAPFDREFISAYYSSSFRINTGVWANISNE